MQLLEENWGVSFRDGWAGMSDEICGGLKLVREERGVGNGAADGSTLDT